MKTVCLILFSSVLGQLALGVPIGFEDRAPGSSPNGLYGDGEVSIWASATQTMWFESGATYVAEGPGAVRYFEPQDAAGAFKGNALVVQAFGKLISNELVNTLIAQYGREAEDAPRHRTNVARLWIQFLVPVVSFALDALGAYNEEIEVAGVDRFGNAYADLAFVNEGPFSTHVEIVAPKGGYLTGFYYEQYDQGPADLAIDNLTYQRVPDSVSGASALACLLMIGFVFRRRRSGNRPVI